MILWKEDAERLGASVFNRYLKAQLYCLLSQAMSFDRTPPSYSEWRGHIIDPDRWADFSRLHWQAYARLDCGYPHMPFEHRLPWVCTANEDRELNQILLKVFDDLALDLNDTLKGIPPAARLAGECLGRAMQRAGSAPSGSPAE